MNIRLIVAQQISFSNPVHLRNCLGILQLASALKTRGITCEVLDLEEFNHLYHSPFEETIEHVVEKILQTQPHLLGISTMTNNLAVVLGLCQRIKRINPAVWIVLGGPGTSFCAAEVLNEFPVVDAIIRGEADEAFPQYIEALMKPHEPEAKNSDSILPQLMEIKGLVFREEERIIDNGWPEPIGNLDELPFPAYEYCKSSKDSRDNEEDTPLVGDYHGISIEAGRGCPYSCTFCSTSHFFKKKHRLKSVTRIIDEILHVREKLGNKRIIFHHDILTLRPEFMKHLCVEIKRRLPGLVWKCHSRFDTILPGMLENMKDAGCNEIFFGIESASRNIQERIKKRLDLTHYNEKLNWLKEYNIRFSLSFIFGIPGEDAEDIAHTLNFAFRAKEICGDLVFIKFHTLAPLLGSELYETWKDKLVYDTYGSQGTTDIPSHWVEVREMIEKHPHIFPLYFYIPSEGEVGRTKANKFASIGIIIDALMKNSILLAYRELGEALATMIIGAVERIELPEPSPPGIAGCYETLMQSIRELILDSIPRDSEFAFHFDALSRFEIAFVEVLQHRTKHFYRVVSSYYDPEELVKQVNTVRKELRYFMIGWDEDESKVKIKEIPLELVRFMQK